MLQGLVIGLAAGGVGMIAFAAMRRGAAADGNRPRRLQSFDSTFDPQETMKSIIRFAQSAGYKIAAFDETGGQLMLEDSASFTSCGFVYPVCVSRQTNNITLVEVGIRSKLGQVGAISSRNHQKCVNGMKAALFAEKRN